MAAQQHARLRASKCRVSYDLLLTTVLLASLSTLGSGDALSVGSAVGTRSLLGEGHPKIFVYDIPSKSSKATGESGKDEQGAIQGLYGLEILFPQLLAASPYVTADPDEADYFYIPTLLHHGKASNGGAASALKVRTSMKNLAAAFQSRYLGFLGLHGGGR